MRSNTCDTCEKYEGGSVRGRRKKRRVIRSDGKEYASQAEAADDVVGDQTNISAVCRGKRKSAYGYGWRFADD